MEKIIFIIKLFSIINTINICYADTQCKDESGKSVDWYIVYKFPRITNGVSPIDTGLKYSYITSESNSSGWILSNNTVTDSSQSIFGQTLKSLYRNETNANLSYFLYNDEPPAQDTDGSHAHAKGVVVTDDTNGYWLIHSVPHFASAEKSLAYEYPKSGGRYGQIALCISFNSSEIDKIVEQLIYMEPKIYSSYVTSGLQSKSSQSAILRDGVFHINRKFRKISQPISKLNILSTAGVQFVSFSKNNKAGVDLYDGIVGPALGINLFAETWRKNPGNPLKSSCNITYHVENVAKLKLKFYNTGDTPDFSYLDDHSKWAISQQSSMPYVCVGDINRMQSQFKRGGGTTCFQSLIVWNALRDWIKNTEPC